MQYFYDFIRENTDGVKDYGCEECIKNLIILQDLIDKGKPFTCVINQDFSGDYLHIDKVKEKNF